MHRAFFFFLLLLAVAQAQETASPTLAATPVPRLVRLHFVPPPLEGTISLGIYDTHNKLVRVLHREDAISDFTIGHDALETTWDGNDDKGQPLPEGKYRARGFLIGEEVKVEGVDYFFNDWVTDESSPHLARISHLGMGDNKLLLETETPAGKRNFLFDLATEKLTMSELLLPAQPPASSATLVEPVASASGKDGTVWAIDHVSKGSSALQVVQLSAEPAILRKLALAPDAPQPIGIAVSPNEDRIFLLEESPALQRVRSLSLQATSTPSGTAEAVSDWKIDFEKKIVAHGNFTLRDGAPVAAPNDAGSPPEHVAFPLRENPLERDHRGSIEVSIGLDADGSFLQSADGLPLRAVSATHHLKRALLARHGESALDVFQDDGAVVEQFRVSNLAQMMAFDCGEFELK